MKLKLGAGILVLLSLLGLVYAAQIFSKHGFDPVWTSHQRYHLLVSAFHIAAMSAATILLSISGLRKGAVENWGAVAVLACGTVAAWPAARVVAGEAMGTDVVLFLVGSAAAVAAALWLTCSKSQA